MKKRMIIMIIALVIVFGGIFGWDILRSYFTNQYMANYQPPPITVSSTKVKQENWRDTIPAVGSLYSYNSVDLSPQQAGQIQNIYFKSGDLVKKGQKLIGQNTRLDKQSLKSEEAQLTLAKLTYQRYLKLSKSSFVSQSELDKSKAQLRQAKASVQKTKETINEKTIKAPFTGKIGIREVNLGQYVSPGDKLTSLQSLNPLRAIFSVPEQYLPKIKTGQTVNLKVDAYPDKTFKGKITAIDSQISNNTRNFQIEANVPNPKLQLYPGMFANVKIILPAKQNVLVVPQTAISYNLYGDIVYVLTPDKDASKTDKPVYVAKTTYVSTGDQRGNEAIITKGLKAGQMIATSGQLKLKNDVTVTINNSVDPSKAPAVINDEE